MPKLVKLADFVYRFYWKTWYFQRKEMLDHFDHLFGLANRTFHCLFALVNSPVLGAFPEISSNKMLDFESPGKLPRER